MRLSAISYCFIRIPVVNTAIACPLICDPGKDGTFLNQPYQMMCIGTSGVKSGTFFYLLYLPVTLRIRYEKYP